MFHYIKFLYDTLKIKGILVLLHKKIRKIDE